VKNVLVRVKLRNEIIHGEALKEITQNCACALAQKPVTPPSHARVSLTFDSRGEELCVDVVYFEGIPHLHAEDRYSAFSECRQLQSRSMHVQIGTLRQMWLDTHGTPNRIRADPEYDNHTFRGFCQNIGSKLVIIAAEALRRQTS
jgi:hypothetical protein